MQGGQSLNLTTKHPKFTQNAKENGLFADFDLHNLSIKTNSQLYRNPFPKLYCCLGSIFHELRLISMV